MLNMSLTNPFGVYVHWPFCLSKCPYCDFNSHVRHGGIDEARFLRAYETEIATIAEQVPDRTVSTIFFRRRHAFADATLIGADDPGLHRQSIGASRRTSR